MQIRSRILNNLLRLLAKPECRTAKAVPSRCLRLCLKDLVQSAFLTLAAYFLCYAYFNSRVLSGPPADPSVFSNKDHIRLVCQNSSATTIETSSPLLSYQNGIESNRPLMDLAKFVNSSLIESNHKYFLCYRSLYDVLRLKPEYRNKNVIDLCLYETDFEFFSFFFKTKFEKQLADNKERENYDYSYNRMFGFYHLTLRGGGGDLFIYLFVSAPPTKYKFETIVRFGYFYLQFMARTDQLDFNADGSLDLAYQDIEQRRRLIKIDKKEQNLQRYARQFRINLPQKIPSYMAEDLNSKLSIGGLYFPLPNDAHLILMYFYPDSWAFYQETCTV